MAEQGPRPDLSQTILETTRRLHDLPGLVADRVLPEVVDLYDGLHDHPALLKYVEDFRILADIEYHIIRLILYFIQLLIQVNELNKAPGLEERYRLKKLLSF